MADNLSTDVKINITVKELGLSKGIKTLEKFRESLYKTLKGEQALGTFSKQLMGSFNSMETAMSANTITARNLNAHYKRLYNSYKLLHGITKSTPADNPFVRLLYGAQQAEKELKTLTKYYEQWDSLIAGAPNEYVLSKALQNIGLSSADAESAFMHFGYNIKTIQSNFNKLKTDIDRATKAILEFALAAQMTPATKVKGLLPPPSLLAHYSTQRVPLLPEVTVGGTKFERDIKDKIGMFKANVDAAKKHFMRTMSSLDTGIPANRLLPAPSKDSVARLERLKTTLSQITQRAKAATNSLFKLNKATDASGKSASRASMNFFRLRAILFTVISAVWILTGAVTKWFEASSQYAETNHLLFSTLANSIGEVNEAQGKAKISVEGLTGSEEQFLDISQESADVIEKTVQELTDLANVRGLNVTDFKRTYATFYEMANAAGVAGKDLDTLSKGITELSYDVASLFDQPFEDTAKAFRSALGGVTTAVRKYGIDISRTTADEYLKSKGIDATYNSLNRASKMMVMYNLLMESSSTASLDLEKSIEQPANQLRVLKDQAKQAAQALGSVLFPVVTPLVTVFILLSRAIQSVAARLRGLLSFLGGSAYDEAYEGWSKFSAGLTSSDEDIYDTAEALDTAAGSAKNLKNQLMGFDEINNINPQTDTGGGTTEGGVGLPTDFLTQGNLWSATIDNIVDKLQRELPGAFKLLHGVVGGFITGFIEGFLGVGATISMVIGKVMDFAEAVLSFVGLDNVVYKLAESFGTALAIGLTLIGLVKVFKLIRSAAQSMWLAFANVGIAVGPFLAVTTAVVALSSAVVGWIEKSKTLASAQNGLTMSFSNATSRVQESTASLLTYTDNIAKAHEKVSSLTSAQAEMYQSMNAAWEDYAVNSTVLQTYVTEIENLASKTTLTADEQARLATAVSGYNDITGSSVEIIDAQSGKLSESTEAIRTNANAWLENAKQQAVSEQMIEIQKQQIALLMQYKKNETAITNLQTQAQELMAQGYYDAAQGVYAQIAALQKDQEELARDSEANTKSANTLTEMLNSKTTAIDEFTAASIADYEKQRSALDAATVDMGSGVDGVTSSLNEMATSASKGAQAVKEAGDKISKTDLTPKVKSIHFKIFEDALDKQFQSTAKALGMPITTLRYVPAYAYAKGGIVDKPTFGVFGEAGIEANIPLRGAHMMPFAKAIASNISMLPTGAFGSVSSEEGSKEQVALLKEQNALLRQLVSKDTSVYLDSVSIAKATNRQSNIQGRSLIAV